MNWLPAAVGLFILFSAWDGHRRGFIRKIVGVLSLVLTLLATSVLTPWLQLFLKENTSLHQVLQRSIAGSDLELMDTLRSLGMEQAAGSYLADQILHWAAFLIALLLAGVLIRGIVFSLGIVSHLPILHGLNKTAGLILGFAEGVVLVWIFFVLITVCASTELGGQLLKMTAQSGVLSWLYRNNLLLQWLGL